MCAASTVGAGGADANLLGSPARSGSHPARSSMAKPDEGVDCESVSAGRSAGRVRGAASTGGAGGAMRASVAASTLANAASRRSK